MFNECGVPSSEKRASETNFRLSFAVQSFFRLDNPPPANLPYHNSHTPMIPSLRIEPADPRPIWRQIEEGVQHLVASGALAAGTAVPSVRDLARELQINPATVSKAYQRLTDAGILSVRRGDGTYVADAPPALPRETRERKLRDGAVRYAGVAVTLGVSEEEAVESLRDAWRTLKDGGVE